MSTHTRTGHCEFTGVERGLKEKKGLQKSKGHGLENYGEREHLSEIQASDALG